MALSANAKLRASTLRRRFLLGSNKVLKVALGKSEKDEHKANLHLLSERIVGKVNDMKTEVHLINRPVLHELARPKQQHLYECGQGVRENINTKKNESHSNEQVGLFFTTLPREEVVQTFGTFQVGTTCPCLALALACGCLWRLPLAAASAPRFHQSQRACCVCDALPWLQDIGWCYAALHALRLQHLSVAMLPAAGHGLCAGGRKGHGGL